MIYVSRWDRSAGLGNMQPSEWTPEQWHDRVEQAIAMTDHATNPGVQATFFLITQRYAELAFAAERKRIDRSNLKSIAF